MQTLVADHPLVAHKLTTLRDVQTETPTFRRLTDELVTLLAYEATRHIKVEPVSVPTPVAVAGGVRLARPVPLVVPVLRAGIGMLHGMTWLLGEIGGGGVGPGGTSPATPAAKQAPRAVSALGGRPPFNPLPRSKLRVPNRRRCHRAVMHSCPSVHDCCPC